MSTIYTVKTVLYNTVWALLRASSVFADPTRCNLRRQVAYTDKPDGSGGTTKALPDPLVIRNNNTDSDFPQAILMYGNWKLLTFPNKQGYQQARGGRTHGLSQELRLILTHRDCQASINDPLDIAVVDALMAQQETLGLVPTPFVYCRRGDIAASVSYGFTDTSNTRRQQSTISIPIEVQWIGEPTPTQTV